MIRNLTFKLDFSQSEPAGKFQKTDQGFIKTYARLTRSGVFDYYDEAGHLVRELRPPEEVFDEESLKTLELMPLTWLHPDRLVTVDNVQQFEVGCVGEKIVRDGDFAGANVIIKDRACVDYVDRAKKNRGSVEFSCGYICKHEKTAGLHESEGKFDLIQRKIRYNHGSLVDKGRAGSDVKLVLDNKKKEVSTVKFRKDSIKTKHFNMDAVEFDVQETGPIEHVSKKLDEAVQVIATLDSNIKNITSEKDILQGKFDQLETDHKTQKEKLDAASNIPSDKLDSLVAERQDVIDVAKKYELKTDSISNDQLKKDIVTKVSPDVNLDDKSLDYINARFDMIFEASKDNSNLGNFNKNVHDTKNDQRGSMENPREKAMKKRNEFLNKEDD